MKIGNHTVKYSFKPARIISDIISLAMVAFSVISALSFTSAHPEIRLEIARADLILLWIFPAACAAVILIYIVITLKSRRFEKYNITKDNAQSVFDWFVFAVSLCKLPLLMSLTEAELTVEERLYKGDERSLFSVTYILCALVLVIIIRLSAHRITSLTKTDNKKSRTVFISSDVSEDDKK